MAPLFTVEELLEVVSARLLAGPVPRAAKKGIRRLCTDSREIKAGDLFVALKGERFDGHAFVDAAIRNGAIGALVQDQYRLSASLKPGERRGAAGPLLLGVPDTLCAYQDMATYHRGRFRCPVVAVTGSNGKTTTKDMVADVLAQKWETLKTEGNLNNRIGVPQTLLRLTSKHEAAVIEMGVDQKSQTTRLCEITRPTIGVITNIGPDHLEFFGSIDASAQAKGELLDFLPPEGGAVLNADDPFFGYLASRARCRALSFGLSRAAQVRADAVTSDPARGVLFQMWLPGKAKSKRVQLQAHGAHNVMNALAAAAVGHLLGLSSTVIAEGLTTFRPATMRSQVMTWKHIRIINDCYNANPASMKVALDMLADLGSGTRTIAVLGDMLELGAGSPTFHREVGAYVADRGVTHLIACGGLGHQIAEGAREAGMKTDRITEVPDATQAGLALAPLVHAGDVVLVKASRGMRLERVIETLTGAPLPTEHSGGSGRARRRH